MIFAHRIGNALYGAFEGANHKRRVPVLEKKWTGWHEFTDNASQIGAKEARCDET